MKTLATTVAILGILTAPAAWAINSPCVATNNDLQAALLQAANEPLQIKLVKGNYRLDLTTWGLSNDFGGSARSGTSLTGGYNATCSSRDPDPSNTVLNDNGTARDYYVGLYGDFTLDGLTFDLSGLLDLLGGSSTIDAAVTVRRIVVTSHHVVQPYAAFSIDWYGDPDTTGTVRIIDSLFHDNANVCAVGINAFVGGVDFTWINDTMNDNGVGLCLNDDTSLQRANFSVYNSIVYNNTLFDVQIHKSALTLVDDTIGTFDKPPFPLIPTPTGLDTNPPQLDAGYHPVAPNSPSIDSGTSIVPGGLPSLDIAGNPRVVGDGVDRGAFESAYDGSTTQMVNTAADSGAGSLRQAIHNANLNPGANTIKFAIGTGCGPHVIAIDSNLEAISGDTVINGYSQPAATRNTLNTGDDSNICIILEPSAGSTATDGLRVASGAGNGVNLTVEGLAIGGFSGNGISLLGGSAHEITGNHFGGVVNGHTMLANGYDIRLGAGVHDSIIGGDGAGSRNIIGGATNSGIFVAGTATPAHDNQIVNNYIGLGWGSDFTNRGNGTNGIYLAGADNTVSDNVIGDNANDGIDIDNTAATGNTITLNSIGGDPGTTTAFGNGLAGVRVENGAGDNAITSNTIGNNTNAGVRIVAGVHNKIRKNSTYLNGGLGIDLDQGGVTPNDPDGSDTLANRDQNFPVLTLATGGHFKGQLSGSLMTTAADYTVDIYMGTGCDSSGNGEGRYWLRSTTVTVPAPIIGTQGLKNFVVDISTDFPVFLTGSTITATATDSLGNTSEFSACQAYVDDTLFADGFDHASI